MSYFTLPLLCALLGLSAQEDFEFSASRMSSGSNFFRLECITDLLRGVPDRAAQFLLEGTDVRDLGGDPILNPDGSSTYLLTRDLEGVYSCRLPTSESTSTSQAIVGEFSFS